MKEDKVYLLHIRDAIDRILTYTAERRNAFLSNTMIQDAVVRNFEIIGEAAKRLSSELRSAHADLTWKQISGMRDKLIHEYFGVNLSLVWNTIEMHMPDLKKRVSEILEQDDKPR